MISERLWKRLARRPEPAPARARVQAHVLSDAGCRRELNEDSACCIHPNDPALLRAKGVLAAVADGMGGQPAGDVASRIAVESLSRAYYDSSAPAERALRDAFSAANSAIRTAANASEGARGMGATCTALALLPGAALFAHMGDTRLYLIRDGEISQLTEDQTKVMRMVRQGILSREDARNREDRNIVLQALGQRASIDGAQWGARFAAGLGDQFVICSDGLHDLVLDEEIQDHVLNRPADSVCQDLIDLAKSRGGFDNITVIFVRLVAETNNPRATSPDIAPEEEENGAQGN